MWALFDRLMRAAKDAAVTLSTDECDVHPLPVLRAMWMPKGQQARVPTFGTNGWLPDNAGKDLCNLTWQVTYLEPGGGLPGDAAESRRPQDRDNRNSFLFILSRNPRILPLDSSGTASCRLSIRAKPPKGGDAKLLGLQPITGHDSQLPKRGVSLRL